MSTLKTNNVQVGQSVTATNNFTLYQPASPDGTVRLGNGNSGSTTADVITATSAGNVGIGTTSPSYKLTVNGNIYSGGDTVYVGNTATYVNYRVGNSDVIWSGGTGLFWRTDIANGTHSWFTSNTERARIDSSGNLLVGSTTTGYTDSRLVLSLDTSTKWVTGPGAGIATRFYVSASNAGGVYLNGTGATSWTAISDERYKTDLVPIADGLAKVCTLRAVTGRLKTDETGQSKAFLIAQDVLSVLPEAVDTTDPERYGLAYTETIPLLVAAIKELKAEVDALKAQLAG